MRKYAVICCCMALITGCAEHDPVLPGVRTPIFGNGDIQIMNESIENLADTADRNTTNQCPYTQDSANVIWDGNRKIFSGFPTNNSVDSNQTPVCANGYVYAGLTTGEVVKVAPNSKKIKKCYS